MTILNNLPQNLASPIEQLVALAIRYGYAHYDGSNIVLDYQNTKTPDGLQLLNEIASRQLQQLNG